jgi:hypothetical protein
MCSKCVALLKQFKTFKETCIRSDKHLRDAIAKTICEDEIDGNIKIEIESSNELDGLYEAAENKKTAKTKKKPSRTRETKKMLVDVKKEVGITVKQELLGDGPNDSEEWNQPLNKRLAQPESCENRKQQRLLRCTFPKCQRIFVTEIFLKAHLEAHKGIDVSNWFKFYH